MRAYPARMATPSMTMNKTIHCAVRRDLARFKTALAAFPDGDKARAEGLHRAWLNFDAQLTEHHEGEHEIAWPALEALGVPQAMVSTLDEEHAAMAATLASTGPAMAALAQSPTRESADKAAAALAALDHATTTHLDHEEREIEQLLLDKKDDPAVKEMGKKFSRRAGLGTAGNFFAWMEDGASAAEKAALRESVPGPVIAIIGGLFGRRYRKEVAPVWTSSGSF
jgi:Hemerythrin HHE cation binding domain